MSDKPEWVFVTKYALTDGINRGVVKEWFDDGRVWVRGLWNSLSPDEFATDWPAAVAQAEAKRIKKIASLRKSIAKLERLTWTEPTATRIGGEG